MQSATRSSASSHSATRKGLVRSPAIVRTSGLSKRSGWSRRLAAVQPLEHSPPRLVGKSSCGTSVAGRSPAIMLMPHCREQYGQWVLVEVLLEELPERAVGPALDVTGALLSGGGRIPERDLRDDRQVGGDRFTRAGRPA